MMNELLVIIGSSSQLQGHAKGIHIIFRPQVVGSTISNDSPGVYIHDQHHIMMSAADGKIENVTCLKEDEEKVKDFLKKIDIFLFFPDWKREEPWARVIAEAMVSGCPIIALNKGGTEDQVLKYNNGFLCKRYSDYYKHVIYFLEHKDIIPIMSKNSIRISKNFYCEKIAQKINYIFKNS